MQSDIFFNLLAFFGCLSPALKQAESSSNRNILESIQSNDFQRLKSEIDFFVEKQKILEVIANDNGDNILQNHLIFFKKKIKSCIPQYLIENFPNIVCAKNYEGETVLTYAAIFNRMDIIYLCNRSGANILDVDGKGLTLLEYASYYNFYNIISYCLSKYCVSTNLLNKCIRYHFDYNTLTIYCENVYKSEDSIQNKKTSFLLAKYMSDTLPGVFYGLKKSVRSKDIAYDEYKVTTLEKYFHRLYILLNDKIGIEYITDDLISYLYPKKDTVYVDLELVKKLAYEIENIKMNKINVKKFKKFFNKHNIAYVKNMLNYYIEYVKTYPNLS